MKRLLTLLLCIPVFFVFLSSCTFKAQLTPYNWTNGEDKNTGAERLSSIQLPINITINQPETKTTAQDDHEHAVAEKPQTHDNGHTADVKTKTITVCPQFVAPRKTEAPKIDFQNLTKITNNDYPAMGKLLLDNIEELHKYSRNKQTELERAVTRHMQQCRLVEVIDK